MTHLVTDAGEDLTADYAAAGRERGARHDAARLATFGVFFVNGAVIGTWVGHIPWIQERFDFSKSTLGLVILGDGDRRDRRAADHGPGDRAARQRALDPHRGRRLRARAAAARCSRPSRGCCRSR